MAYFEWAQDMVIDNGPIDEDHRKLVDQVNALHSATTQGRGQDVVAQLLAAVIADTQEHLRREEQLMEQAKFPDLERHKETHVQFVEKLHDLRQKHHSGRPVFFDEDQQIQGRAGYRIRQGPGLERPRGHVRKPDLHLCRAELAHPSTERKGA